VVATGLFALDREPDLKGRQIRTNYDERTEVASTA
jgi:hypothetical protein